MRTASFALTPDAEMDRLFKAVADPTRRRILKLLSAGPRSVSEVVEQFRLAQPTISCHLAVLRGNLAENGCIVKTAAVAESMYRFNGRARVFDEMEAAHEAILEGNIEAGDVVVIRYEGPKGGPGMQEMLTPTSMAGSTTSIWAERLAALGTEKGTTAVAKPGLWKRLHGTGRRWAYC